ncbi:cadherin-99C-like isoform X2 [Saccostrea echinata]|uniref:cadherin-99C-like isoform X2 n=1 Tax=Saccostrea echinata TaxID=191078 RepID=UPI002A82DC53|nr:cadherin-99C-like isoform X2 [Saccostrea echinata]
MQEPCSSPDPNIRGTVYESTFSSFDPNSPLYRTDTTIEGINQGTVTESGVNITFVRGPATPADLNLDSLFELITLPVSNSQFGSRTFIRLKSAIDRDGNLSIISDDLDNIEFQLSCRSLKDPRQLKFFLMQLEIRDINDNAPIFRNAPYSASVDESAPVGTTVYSGITATDLDAGSNKEIEYAIVPGDGSINDGSTRFALPISSRGEIVVSTYLDFESVQSYNLTITASDKASNITDRKQTTSTITITINDVDDLGPRFVYSSCFNVNNVCFNPTYTTSISSGSMAGTLVFNPVPVDSGNPNAAVDIIAEDGDTLNAPITFTIRQTLPSGYQNRFQVTTQKVSGSANRYRTLVSQTASIDRSEVTELELFIEAQENVANRYSNRATIKLSVAAANNNNPVLSVPFQGYIYENSPIGTIPRNNDGSSLLRISVTDPDLIVGETGQYTFTVNTGLFRVNSEGYVEAAAVINYESTPVVTFTVTGTEVGTQNPRSGTVQVTVNVRDLNDNTPVFGAPRYVDSIVEGDYTTSNQVLLDVSASDADSGANGDIVYTIQSVSNNGASKFSIQPSSQTGRATISCIGSVAEGEIYVIMVAATDQGQPVSERRTATVPMEVTVTPLGTRPPVIEAPAFTIYVSEAVPITSSVFTIPARDPEGQLLSFSIISGNVNNDFGINLTTGEVRTQRTLDRETTPQYTLNIRVKDQSGLSAQTTLTIIIQDVNDNNPIFTPVTYTFSVLEGRSNEDVGTVTATDADQGANANINYQISTFSSTGSASLFTILPSGQIRTATALDYETRNVHVILVLGIDGGASSRTGTATVNINVQDVQDTIPLFTETNIVRSIPERESIGTSVVQVTALDQDVVDQITYKFSTGDFSVFSINQNSGLITNNQLLQYETKNSYVFTVTTVEGENSNALSATATVTINLEDINNYPPVIQAVPSNLRFLENIPIGTTIVSNITATDADAKAPNNQIKYSITGDATAQKYFYIYPESGRIFLTQTIRGMGISQFILQVTATDGGTPPLRGHATLVINIQDSPYANDSCASNLYSPIFTAPLYFVNVLEGDYSINNQLLIQILASDNDFGINGEIVFDIQSVSNNGAEKFKLVQTERDEMIAIVCRSNICRGETYVIILRASDMALPMYSRRSSSVPVEVKVAPFEVPSRGCPVN